MPDLTELIRNALQQEQRDTATATADLNEVIQQFSEASSAIADGEATLALEALDPGDAKSGNGADPFAILPCWNQNERVIRVAEFGFDGFPIRFFRSLAGWELPNNRRGEATTRGELEADFRNIVLKRDSDVLVTIRFIIGNMPKQPAAP